MLQDVDQRTGLNKFAVLTAACHTNSSQEGNLHRQRCQGEVSIPSDNHSTTDTPPRGALNLLGRRFVWSVAGLVGGEEGLVPCRVSHASLRVACLCAWVSQTRDLVQGWSNHKRVCCLTTVCTSTSLQLGLLLYCVYTELCNDFNKRPWQLHWQAWLWQAWEDGRCRSI